MRTKMAGGDKKNLIVALGLALAALLSGCGKMDRLQDLAQYKEQSSVQNHVQVDFCTDPAYDQKQYLKTIIILDHSGSNQNNYKMASDGSGAPALPPVIDTIYATDPTGVTRYGDVTRSGTLLNYLNGLPANNPLEPTRFFALVDFNSSVGTKPAVKTIPPNSSGFTSDIVQFFSDVQADSVAGTTGNAPDDGAGTDYLGALDSAYSIMNADIKAASDCAALPLGSPSPGAWCPAPGKQIASSYVIIFMSDGSPITDVSGIAIKDGKVIYVDGSGNPLPPGVVGTITMTKESGTNILGHVGAMVALEANKKFVSSVNLFSIYYYHAGNVDAGGQKLLRDMAKVGNGIAYDALSNSNIDYNQFQPPKKRIKYKLANVFVTNASVVWWTDGKLHADTDMDGLPDDVEKAWGSDPLNAYSGGNGVTDLVKYRAVAGGAYSAINYAAGICSGIARTVAPPGNPYVSSEPSGLNDCEKKILGDPSVASNSNPDSNADLIPNWLEFKNGIPFQFGTAPAVNVPNQDGYSLHNKVKLSLPINMPTGELLNYRPAVYDLNLVSTDAIQDCYKLSVSYLPTLAADDTIRVDVIERSELLGDNDLYRVAKKMFPAGSLNLYFNDWNNAAEKLAGTWNLWP